MYRDMDLEWRMLQALELRNKSAMLTNTETFHQNDIVYLLAPHASAFAIKCAKVLPGLCGAAGHRYEIDETHYLLKDITGRTLKGDYHINRIKKAGEITPEGVANTYEQLRKQIGLPITNQAALPSPQASHTQLSMAA